MTRKGVVVPDGKMMKVKMMQVLEYCRSLSPQQELCCR